MVPPIIHPRETCKMPQVLSLGALLVFLDFWVNPIGPLGSNLGCPAGGSVSPPGVLFRLRHPGCTPWGFYCPPPSVSVQWTPEILPLMPCQEPPRDPLLRVCTLVTQRQKH